LLKERNEKQMKLSRRFLTAGICIILSIAMLLTGCGNNKADTQSKPIKQPTVTVEGDPTVIFGKTPVADGMKFTVEGKGKLENSTVLKKEYTKLKKDTVINFKLEDKYIDKLADKKLMLRLEYYESTSKSFKIKYNGQSGVVEKSFEMVGNNNWGGLVIKIDDAKFSKKDKFDFSLSLDTATAMWLRSVTVCEDETTPMTAATLLKTDYFTSNGKVIEANVKDYGAVGDGVADDSIAFQTALRDMKTLGGALYVPAGTYKITQDLIIPSGVTLLGDFNRPTRENPKAAGTILAVYVTNIADGNTDYFMTMKAGSCVKGFTIWYPEQDLSSGEAIPYNYTIGISDNIGVTIEDIYLVNSYNGITHKNGDLVHYQQMIKNIYGTPLRTGYMAGRATDSDRHQFFDFSPKFWLGSGLANIPKETVLKNWLLAYGVGFSLGDVDFHYVNDINIEGYKIGMHVRLLHGRIYNFNITDCNVCLYIDNVVIYGGQLTKGVLKANGGENPVALLVGESVTEKFTATNLEISSTGSYALNYLGTGSMALQDSKISVTGTESIAPLHSAAGRISIMNTTFSGGKNDAVFDKDIEESALLNCSSESGSLRIENASKDMLTVETLEENKTVSLNLEEMNRVEAQRQYQNKMPATQKLYNVADYGAKSDKENPVDISALVQKAIDDAAANGGGIVYIPAGDYRLENPITVKSGVELRGANDYFHYILFTLNYTSLLTDYGKGKPKSAPLITLQENAGVRGLSIIYDVISQETVQPYATTIQATGKDDYVINTTVVGGYFIADFNTYKCDNHYIESLNFFTFGTGISMGGGSENGVLLNGHSNPGEMWSTGYNKNSWSGDWTGPLITYVHKNVTAFHYGKSINQVAFMTATFGAKYGVKIDNGANVYIVGHGTDLSVNDVFITGNSNAVIIDLQAIGTNSANPYESTAVVADKNFTGNLAVYNMCAWNINDAAVRVDNGNFSLVGASIMHAGKAAIIATGGNITMTGAIVGGRSLGDIEASVGVKAVTAFGNIVYAKPKYIIADNVKKFGSDLK